MKALDKKYSLKKVLKHITIYIGIIIILVCLCYVLFTELLIDYNNYSKPIKVLVANSMLILIITFFIYCNSIADILNDERIKDMQKDIKILLKQRKK